MTCHHRAGDPDCSSTPGGRRELEIEQERRANEILKTVTPDAEKYQIIDVVRVGTNLVLKVKYPNCTNCSYEGTKVMVFLNVSEAQALLWKRIDPHFRNPKTKWANEAPSPSARFPGTSEGWHDAVHYATQKFNNTGREGKI